MARNYAALFHEYLDEMADLTDAEFGRLARALLVYSSTGEFPALNGNERLFKRRVIAQEDRVQENYNAVTERNRENGKTGGRPKKQEKPRETQRNPEKPTETQENPPKPSETQKTQSEIKIKTEIKATSPNGEAARARTRASSAAAVYLDRVNASASQTSLEQLTAYEQEMGTEVCVRAMDIALDNKVASPWPYIKAVLRKWQGLGVKCLADIDRLEEKREKGTGGTSTSGKNRNYFDPESMDRSLRKDMEWLEKFSEGKV